MNYTPEQLRAAEQDYYDWCKRCAKDRLPIECEKERYMAEFLAVKAIEVDEPVVDLSEYQFGHSSMSSSEWAAQNLVASGVAE